jgi:glucan biosynthesis protein C
MPAVERPTKAQQEERLHGLDSLRATAMFLGIALHAGTSLMSTKLAPIPFRDVSAHSSFDVMFLVIHGFRMHLFFFIAGFFGRHVHERLGSSAFLRQRFKRIGIPFLLGLVFIVVPTLLLIVLAAGMLSSSIEISLQKPPDSRGFPPAHLWFLQFLLLFYPAAVLWIYLSKRFGNAALELCDTVLKRVYGSPLRFLAFVPLTVFCLWNGPIWGEAEYPGISFVPKFRALGHYGLFFLAGWLMHRHRQLLPALQKHLPVTFAAAFGAVCVHGYLLGQQPLATSANFVLLKIVGLTCAAIYAWSMTFGLMGVFLRFASAPKPWVRYMADASYWCYLAHLPVVFALQIMVATWPLNGWLKFLLILVITIPILLLTYEYRVRYTYVGTMLNGKRTRPPLAATPRLLPKFL